MSSSSHEITQLLQAWSNGDQTALDALMPLVHPMLRGLARKFMASERRDHTLGPAALVNEAYMRLIGSAHTTWKSRAQFFAFSAELMRHILVDYERSHRAAKRGGNLIRVPLENDPAVAPSPTVDLIDLDNAMNALRRFDARKCRVVEMRFFGGASVEETAAMLKVSPETVFRDIKLATAWLRRELDRKGQRGG